MKRPDLEEMGLEKETIDKIMAWNGEDINAEKAKTTRAEGERDALQAQLAAATPYLVGIMDEFSNWETEKIISCKPTQVGGTECLNNMLGYVIAQDPAPTMIVEPTNKLAESFSRNRLVPMFKKSPALRGKFHQRESAVLELQFDSMYITLVGSNASK